MDSSRLQERDAVLSALLLEVERLRAIEEVLRAEVAELEEAALSVGATRDHKAEMYDFVPVACLTLDRFGAIREANSWAVSLLRLPRPQLLGVPLLCLLAPVHRPRFLANLLACKRNCKDVAFEVSLKGEGEQAIPARLLIRAIDHDSGGYSVAVVDLREREAAFAESARLAESERATREATQLTSGLLVLLSRGLSGPLGRVLAAAMRLAGRGALDSSVSVPLATLLQARSLVDHRLHRGSAPSARLPQLRGLRTGNAEATSIRRQRASLRNRSR